MKKRLLSIILIVVSMFTVILPMSAYAENKEVEPYYYYTNIKVQGKDAWGNFYGGWHYKTWNGKLITPEVKVYDGYDYKEDGECKSSTKLLVQGQDYKLTFGNNRDMGYCKVKITGLGEYSTTNIVGDALRTNLDSLTQEDYLLSERQGINKGPIFVIRPLGTKLNKVKGQKKAVKVTWKKQAKKMSVKRITGYQIQLSTRKDFETYRLVTVKGYKNTSKVVKKLKGKKKYYVRIRTYYQCKDGFKAYSTWSKAKVVTTKR